MPIMVRGEGTTHVSDLTVGTQASKPVVGNWYGPISSQHQTDTRCVSLDQPVTTPPQVQRMGPVQVTQMSDMAQVSPGSMFQSVQDTTSTAPDEMMQAIGQMDLFAWGEDEDEQTEGMGATSTEQTMDKSLGKVSVVKDVKSLNVH